MQDWLSMEHRSVRILVHCWDFLLLTVLFVVSCLPVVTVGPAFCALYNGCARNIRKSKQGTLRMYFGSLWENLLPGILSWLIVAAVDGILLFSIYTDLRVVHGAFGAVMLGLFLAIMVIFTCISVYVFPMLSRFHVGVGQLFANALYLALDNAWRTLAMAAVTVVAVMIALFGVFYYPLITILTPGLYTLALCSLMEPVLEKYEREVERSGCNDE